MDLRAMMAAKMAEAMAGGDDDDAPPARPDMRAQRLELWARFDAYNKQHRFTPGGLVAEKDGLGIIKQSGGGRALIFWRALVPSDPLDKIIIRQQVKRQRINRVDCIIASVEFADDGTSAVLFVPHDSACLRPLTDEEAAELDAVNGGPA